VNDVASPSPARTSAAVEDYVKSIYSMSAAGEGPVQTNELAARLGVTAASVSAMIKRLAGTGLVEHEPYRGVRLTPAGERLALHVVRRHRLLELFLSEVLHIPWDRVHQEAEILEHAISDYLIDAIDETLGRPEVDPHGDPIPTRDLVLAADDGSIPLTDLEVGRAARITQVSDLEPEMLLHLTSAGIALNDRVELREREPFGGSLTISVAGVDRRLPHRVADGIRVMPLDGAAA